MSKDLIGHLSHYVFTPVLLSGGGEGGKRRRGRESGDQKDHRERVRGLFGMNVASFWESCFGATTVLNPKIVQVKPLLMFNQHRKL